MIVGSLSIFDALVRWEPLLGRSHWDESENRLLFGTRSAVAALPCIGNFLRSAVCNLFCHLPLYCQHYITSSRFSCRVSVIAGFTLWYFRADYTHRDEIRAESRAAHKLAARALAACFISLARPSQTPQTTLPARNKVTCSPAWSDSKLDL